MKQEKKSPMRGEEELSTDNCIKIICNNVFIAICKTCRQLGSVRIYMLFLKCQCAEFSMYRLYFLLKVKTLSLTEKWGLLPLFLICKTSLQRFAHLFRNLFWLQVVRDFEMTRSVFLRVLYRCISSRQVNFSSKQSGPIFS